jgi:glycosyltransferase involved in cell wall biosynthesis
MPSSNTGVKERRDGTNPQFSVLIPVYNREEYVCEAIDSVLAQTFRDYELIVVDDGSTDQTPNVLRSYGNRLKTVYQNNQGSVVAKNRAASVATGEYLVFLDSDDILFPFALSTYNSIIDKYNFHPLIISKMLWCDGTFPSNEELSCPDVGEVFLFCDYLSKTVTVSISFSTIVIRRAVFEEVGGLGDIEPSFDDLNFLLKIGTIMPCAIINAPMTVGYRSHPGNSCRDFEPMVRTLSSIARAELGGEYPGGLKRLLDRRAYIGGEAWTWVRRALQAGRLQLAVTLFMKYSVMIAMGALRKFYTRFTASCPCVIPILSEQNQERDLEKSAGSAGSPGRPTNILKRNTME